MASRHIPKKIGRTTGGVLAVGLSIMAIAGFPARSVCADPATAPAGVAPASASEAVQKLVTLSRQSEQLNEAALGAQADLDKKLGAQHEAERRLAADHSAVVYAEDQIKKYQPVVDLVANSTYQGARTGSMFAVLGAEAPQQLLDQMSLLEFLGSRTAHQIKSLDQATASVKAAETAAAKSAGKARAVTDQANAVRTDLRKKQSTLSGSIAQVTQAFAQLSAKDRRAYVGSPFPPGFDVDVMLKSLPKGSSASALAAALTRIGDPYVWGATGPSSFDCSGLVQWAFRQIGKSLPRTSEQQAQAGIPVDEKDLQPGDVVTFYSDVSHVGIYAGNGNIIHASTFGVPVAVAPMSSGGPFHNARRY